MDSASQKVQELISLSRLNPGSYEVRLALLEREYLLAMPGSWLGRAPKGNVGSTQKGIFEEK
jgi:hypothetical protein